MPTPVASDLAIQAYAAKTRASVEHWLTILEPLRMTELLESPGRGAWSMGQLYTHLLMSGHMFFLLKAEQCLRKEKTSPRKINMAAQVMYYFGAFPPVRVKMPTEVAHVPPQPDSLETIQGGLEALIQHSDEVAKALRAGYDPDAARSHPLFGKLNAWDWYRALAMHMDHHRAQERRLHKFLETGDYIF
jgi:hypothetical protein